MITAGAGVAALSGCSGDGGEDAPPAETTDAEDSEATETEEPTETATPAKTETDSTSSEPASTAVFDWERFGYDRQNSGSIDARGPPEAPEQRWQRELAPVPGTLALKNGVLYVPSNDGEDSTVYALEAADGSTLWEYDTGELHGSVPAIQDGTVYVGGRLAESEQGFSDPPSGAVHAIAADSGEKQWTYSSTDVFSFSTGPVVYDGTVYLGSEVPAGQSYFVAVDAATGEERWTKPISQYVSSPAISPAGDALYVGGNETLAALSPDDGDVLWTFETGEFLKTAPSVRDGTVYVGNRDGLYAVSAETGEEEWFYESPTYNVTDASQAVTEDAVYLTDGAGVSALARETGAELWRESSSADQIPLATSNAVYATGGRGASFEAFSTETGEILWELEIAINGRPIFSEGWLYGGGVDGVYALE